MGPNLVNRRVAPVTTSPARGSSRARTENLSHGGRYYRERRGVELQRKRSERARVASAAYGFIETHPEFTSQWHPRFDEATHAYRLSQREENDWRGFLREHGWAVGEKGRKSRIGEYLPPNREPRPLSSQGRAARERFHTEGLGRSPESFRPLY